MPAPLGPIGAAFPQYDALFARTEGWTGGDAILSVALTPGVTLWLFGDSSFGAIRDGRRVCPLCLANNSLALQRGADPATAAVEFFFGPAREGKPTAFFAPPDGRGWLWPGHGLRTARGLSLFFAQFERDPHYRWGRYVGLWLAEVPNPDDPPPAWRVTYRPVPWSRAAADGNRLFGLALLPADGSVYIYGYDEEVKGGWATRRLLVARAPEDRLADFDQWRFHADGAWVADWRGAARGFVAAPELSVTYQPALREYVAVYTEFGLSKQILLRRAPTPTGPWGAPRTIYECPEDAGDGTVYCYAAKGHQTLATAPDELIVSYATNGSGPIADARLYFPRFVRVRFASP